MKNEYFVVWYKGGDVGVATNVREAELLLTGRFGVWDADEAYFEEVSEEEYNKYLAE